LNLLVNIHYAPTPDSGESLFVKKGGRERGREGRREGGEGREQERERKW
jgi:hypothetical protein